MKRNSHVLLFLSFLLSNYEIFSIVLSRFPLVSKSTQSPELNHDTVQILCNAKGGMGIAIEVIAINRTGALELIYQLKLIR